MSKNKDNSDRLLAKAFWPFGPDGFSLAEIMVGAGILGALSLVIVNLTTDINRSQRSMENRFQMGQLQSRIYDSLRNRESCSLTVDGSARSGSSDGVVLDDIVDDDGTPLLTNGDVIGGADPGDSSGAQPIFSVDDIRLISYVDGDGEHTNSPDGTSTDPDGGTDLEYGDAIIRVSFTRGDTGSANNQGMQERNAYGSVSFERDFQIKVLVNEATSNIIGCYAAEENVAEAACDSLRGIYSPADGRCREIQIQEDPTDTTNDYAITSRGHMLIDSGGGLNVGNYLIGDSSELAGDGNLVLQNNAEIGGNTNIGENLEVAGTGQFDGNVGIGAEPTDPGPRLYVLSDGNNSGVSVSDGTDNVDILTSDSESVSIQATGSRDGLKITTGTGDMIRGDKGGVDRFIVSDTGQVSIPNPGSNDTMSLEIGDASNSKYFPAYIRNQPADVSNSGDWNFTTNSSVGDEIATKRWAAGVIYAELTDSALEDVINNIEDYAANNQLDAIKRMVCSMSSSRSILGDGANDTSGLVASSYSGGVCTHTARHCTSGADRCGRLFVSGIQSSGEIFSSTRIRVESASGYVRLESNGQVRATGNITSETLVQAPTVRGTRTNSKSAGVCAGTGSTNCATRFGIQKCPWRYMMIGLAYGNVICAPPP